MSEDNSRLESQLDAPISSASKRIAQHENRIMPETMLETSKTVLITEAGQDVGGHGDIHSSLDFAQRTQPSEIGQYKPANQVFVKKVLDNKHREDYAQSVTLPNIKYQNHEVTQSNMELTLQNESAVNVLSQKMNTEEQEETKLMRDDRQDSSTFGNSVLSGMKQFGRNVVKRIQKKKTNFDKKEVSNSVSRRQSLRNSMESQSDDLNSVLSRSKTGYRRQSSMMDSSTAGMKKSMSGFDVGQAKSQTSFFSSVRQSQEQNSMKGFINTTKLKGKQFIDKSINQQGNRYEKKFPFERGQYHQCIPNPKDPKQRITVQLVERVLEETASKIKQETITQEMFVSEQVASKNTSISQTYERFTLKAPDDEIEKQSSSSSESENEEDKAKTLMTQFGEYSKKLYNEKSLFNEVDKLMGIQNQHYANIQIGRSNDLSSEARQGCKEFAVIAFWEFDYAETFVCKRFFIIPNPMKRIIKDADGTVVHQVLFNSQHSDDVFFFWKGKDTRPREIDDNQIREVELQLTFLKLDWQPDELEMLSEMRNIFDHCKEIYTIKQGSLLAAQIDNMHEMSYKDQKQLPNPVLIEALANPTDSYLTKYIVFTAFLLQTEIVDQDPLSGRGNQIQISSFTENKKISVKNSWYPIIHFYDIEQQEVVWEIYGGSQFMGLNRSTRNVRFLTNDIWNQVNQETFDDIVRQDGKDFSRHNDFSSFICQVKFLVKPKLALGQDLLSRCPEQPIITSHKLTFGKSKDLAITEPYKLVSSYIHNQDERATLIFHGLGAYTFQFKNAISLTRESSWEGKCNGKADSKYPSSFTCQLKFVTKGDQIVVTGSGTDENEGKVKVDVQLKPIQFAEWSGYFETNDLVQELDIKSMVINENERTLKGQWIDDYDTECRLEGRMDDPQHNSKKSSKVSSGQQSRKRNTDVEFTLYQGQETRVFKGQLDALRTKIEGKCSSNADGEMKYAFKLQMEAQVTGDLKLCFGDNAPIERPVYLDYQTKQICTYDEDEEDNDDISIEINATEAVDQAEIIFSILYRDAQFIYVGNQAWIQAKLKALAEEDNNNNGKGVSETMAVLYNIDSNVEKSKVKKVVGEPKESDTVRFYLNQSFLRTQEKGDRQLWHAGPSVVSISDDQSIRLFGSVLYEECGSNEVRLNMFSADILDNTQQLELDYPQEPVPQSWIVDYPLLAYKTFTPRNKEITIVHMAYNAPQKVLHLGDWEFVCFVNHTQMVEKKCFKKTKETNCDIMILVKRDDKCRLMSFKSNPWLQYHEYPPDEKDGGDEDIVKERFYMFSGDIGVIPTEEWNGKPILQDTKNHVKYKQRFNNDKIQTCQLITKTLGSEEQYMLIIQFNDSIVQASLNRNFFKLVCEPQTMIRRHLIRGYNEQIYFAETSGSVDKIYQIEFHPTKSHEITKKEIYQLAGGKLVAFESDGENIQNDFNANAKQSIFIMDDSQKIYLLKNEDGVKFFVKKVIDFTKHMRSLEVNALMLNEWAHVHVTQRTLTMNGVVYNLTTKLSEDVDIPKAYFGRESSKIISSEDDEDGSSSSSDDPFPEDDEDAKGWSISSVEGMSMTTNMLVVGQKNQQEFCFVLKQAPGTRKVSIVGFQQLHEIEQMLFVSNAHILINFKGGKSVTLLSNGSIIHQEASIQKLLENSERVIAESQLYKGVKTVLLQDEFGENNEQIRQIALQFSRRGEARLVGIFNDFEKQTNEIFSERTKIFQKQAQEEFQILSNPLNLDNADASSERLVDSKLETISPKYAKKKQILLLGDSPTREQDLTSEAKEIKLQKIRYAKEFFVSEKGESIKMAALVSTNPKVIKLLQNQKSKRTTKKKKSKSGALREHYISIVKIKQNLAQMEKYGVTKGDQVRFTVIVFHCLDAESQEQFVTKTQYCVVGNYLCHRARDEQDIWVSKLKEQEQDYIQPPEDDQLTDMDKFYSEYISVCISIDKMTRKVWLPHIQLTEVPKSYLTTIKARNQQANKLMFYDNLLQVTIGTNGMIFDLDSDPIREVDSIENIDALMRLDTFVNTGFIMSISFNAVKKDEQFFKRVQIFTNEYCNLLLAKVQRRYTNKKPEFEIVGMLYQTFSDVDLWELKKIQTDMENRKKITYIDPETILSNFEGHTIFSIFYDKIQVYEQILKQLQEMEFSTEPDINGIDVENRYLKRLHRVLNMPTSDLAHSKDKLNKKKSQGILSKNYCCKKITNIAAIMKYSPIMSTGNNFKCILKKSLNFTNARFRESLMEMSMMCRENAINNFVENQDDIQILFKSMSPSVVALFEDSFKRTRFTDQVTNADWRIGDSMEVIGSMSSVVLEKEVNKHIKKSQERFFSAEGDVQNRQVEARMLQIDWIFASASGKEKCGFAEFVVALSQAPHESLFSTDLIKTMVDHFWSRYYRAVLFGGLFPFITYFSATLYYMSKYAVDGIEEDFNEVTFEFFLRWIVFTFAIYFSYFEIRCVYRDGVHYFLDVFNYVDMVSHSLNIYLVFKAAVGEHDQQQKENIRSLAAGTVVLSWLKAFYWLRLFGPTSFFVRMIVETLADIKVFLILFVLILMTFGNALLILDQGRTEDQEPLYTSYFSFNFLSVMLNQYELALGEFNTDGFISEDGGSEITWLLFCLATMITQIMFLNMLIAIMGDTFERVTESREQSALVEKITILADYVYLVPREEEKKKTLNRYLFAVSPKTLGADEVGSWEGTASMIKATVEENVMRAQKSITRKIKSLQNEYQDSTKKMSLIDERLNELHGASQRQQGALDQILKILVKADPQEDESNAAAVSSNRNQNDDDNQDQDEPENRQIFKRQSTMFSQILSQQKFLMTKVANKAASALNDPSTSTLPEIHKKSGTLEPLNEPVAATPDSERNKLQNKVKFYDPNYMIVEAEGESQQEDNQSKDGLTSVDLSYAYKSKESESVTSPQNQDQP